MFIQTVLLISLISPLDIHQINTRRNYYQHPLLARLFENKVTVTVRKIEHQIFNLLDINKYLFAGHPRENE